MYIVHIQTYGMMTGKDEMGSLLKIVAAIMHSLIPETALQKVNLTCLPHIGI